MRFKLNKKNTTRLKWVFTLTLLVFIAYKISRDGNEITHQYFVRIFANPALTLALIFLTFVNWFFDTLSWKLISPLNKEIPFSKILSANLVSQYVGLLTPFGVGEYRAKMRVFKEKQERNQSIVSTISYRWSKAVAKFGVCILAIAFIVGKQIEKGGFLFLFMAILVWLVFVIKYKFFLHVVFRFFKLDQKLNISANQVNIYPTLLPATIKFLSYVVQFAFVITFLEETEFIEAFAFGVIVYSVASLLPQLSVLDPFVKGGVGALILPNLPPEIILTATFLVWILNVGLPSIAGAILWFKKV